MGSRKWVLRTTFIAIAILVLMCGTTYIYDPCSYYQLTDNNLKSYSSKFVNPGIAKNAEYDSVIIGSSMTQNFSMDTFRERLNINPVKLTVGAMSIREREMILSLVTNTEKASTFVFSIDLHLLTDEKPLDSFPSYLYDESILNDYKYLLGYENWMRITPVSIVSNVLQKSGIDIGLTHSGNVDHIGEWQDKFVFGAEILITDWRNQTKQVSKQNLAGIKEIMMTNVDTMIDDILNQCGEKQIIMFFPPYSALYWYGAMRDGYMDSFQDIKRYIVQKLDGLNNVELYDFQCMPIITNLDYYKDTTHYSADINDIMVGCIAEHSYIVDIRNIDDSIQRLHDLLAVFTYENTDWLRKP